MSEPVIVQPTERFTCESEPVWTLPNEHVPVASSLQKDNWFMQALTKDLQEGATPSIIIGGQRRGGKSWMSLKIAEELVKRCHRVKFAYRDKGLPTEKKYDLHDAQFDVSAQLLFSLRTIPNLLRKPESAGLPYGSPMIGDETSVAANALNFNSPLVKLMIEIHDTAGFRLIPIIFNVPGSIARATYQLRETAQYFMQMQTRGVAKVYKTNPNVTGRVWVKTVGWLGYRDPFTKRVTARIEAPSKETLKTYYELKEFYFNRLLNRSERRLASLAQEGYLGPYDEPSDYLNSDSIMTMPSKRKNDIPRATDDGDEVLEV